jgi:type I restriction enzyme S subunit
MSAAVKLADVAELVMGQSPPSTSYNDVGDGLPFYQGKTDFGATYPTPRIYCREPKKLAKSGDILMSVRAPVGATNLCDSQSCIGRGIAAIRANGIDRDFLYFYLKEIETYIDSLGSGAIFKAINKSQLAELPINEAGIPLPEQKKIAHILSTVQRAIEAQERIIQTTTELKKALMHKLFTEGLRNEPQKQTEIGPVPESWEVCKVGDVAKIQSGGTPTREIAENWNGGTIPWVKTGEINYCVIHDTEEKITPTGLANSAARLFPKGTLLMAMYGQGITRGRVGLLGIEAATNQACASITPTDKMRISSVFLYYFFEYHYEDLRKLGHGANQRNMNAALIRSFPLAFPKPDEQAAVVSAFESLDQKRALHERKKTRLQDLFRTFLHELMTAKTRVHGIPMQGDTNE